ncbi:MAG: membrane protein insertase YidC [Burkholderiales bacterium]
MDTQRLILFVLFSFSSLMLWENWQKENRPKPVATTQGPTSGSVPGPAAKAADPSLPKPASGATAGAATVPATPAESAAGRTKLTVETDVMNVDIDTRGGDIVRVELPKHKDPEDTTKTFVFMSPEHKYTAQSGFADDALPNHTTIYKAAGSTYRLADGQNDLEVKLEAELANGVRGVKTLRFTRGSYVIEVGHRIYNGTAAAIQPSAYFHLTRDGRPPPGDSAMMSTYSGPAVYTATGFYQKLAWSDIDKDKLPFPKTPQTEGWVAMVQHYFVAAWLPAPKLVREFYADKSADGAYRAGFKTPLGTIAPGASATVVSPLYVGPQEQSTLRALAPGLDVVVDYGWLKLFAEPLFWVLQWFYNLTNNWGWAIVLLTLSIKILFYPLSAASYRSMAKMKLVTPRLTKLREQYGDDRVKLNQAMMELYKTEKINPVGGCLPIAIQIPVFIALYWVLLGAVELRQAPWLGWIKDLSIPDPWYILPVLMLISMVVQTKMNPTPPDPVQAKVMMAMPFVFGIMFFWFPAGLVLYWFVNNLLSIAQQWQITRMFTSGAEKKPAKG